MSDLNDIIRLQEAIRAAEYENKLVPGAVSAEYIHGLQVSLQDLINANLRRPEPNFPPNIHDQ